MTKIATMVIAVLAVTAGLSAQAKKGDTQNLTGTWNMGLEGGHVIPVALVLTQDGDVLSGTIAMPTQNFGQTVEILLKGELSSGAFALSGTVEGAKDPTTIEIKGKLNDAGMLEGTVTMSGRGDGHHDMPYTAERLKERK
jgi:hypothetical protein